MTKIALLVPYESILQVAEKVIEEHNYNIEYKKVIQTEDAVNEARMAIKSGARIIIARGFQAKLIKDYTNIPLVEMRFHAQEIGLLLKRAKAILKKECPVVGLIVFSNMLCNMSHMEELFNVKLHIRSIEQNDEVPGVIEEMKGLGAELIIGGEIVCREAQMAGFPVLPYESTEESVLEALQIAERMSSATETEKETKAQFETVLDTAFHGIVKVDAEGKIITLNRLVENLIGKTAEEVEGLEFKEVFPWFEGEIFGDILSGKRENYSTSLQFQGKSWILLAASIRYDDQISGAIISLQRMEDFARSGKKEMQEVYLQGFTAQKTFRDIRTKNRRMQEILDKARKYALSDSPVMIYGEIGTEYAAVAEAIHNNSVRRTGPFVSVNVRGLEYSRQMEALFGGEPGEIKAEINIKGAFTLASHGTVLINGIEHLNPRVQYMIYRIFRPGYMEKTDYLSVENLDVRIIVCTHKNLKLLAEEEKFNRELFYFLQGLTLEIPPLRERAEDLEECIDQCIQENCRKYNKYLKLTKGGRDRLLSFPWEGNLVQIRSFCERLVLETEKRSVSETEIQNLFGSLYPLVRRVKGEEKIVVYNSKEAADLSALLKKHNGNRSLVAQEMGISTTTLWRRMKKFGIEASYDSR
ncbi:PrpR N-terminal domain-containing protein [Ruminococcus sp. CLA-AA-H200]|uniref:PrpR N-terminal domain-containing protein n=1 Tax=Ruminococcus turbiniformis TaxID=2881258 RepID=A0ABS8G349_9FIRM|nr:PrpR N-terminal domain-containing protein [Ruminococcus turbiniformis]MCC2255359.1 PrpR N-terminal domain-containing protein [Ruminococcus turbiniformis]